MTEIHGEPSLSLQTAEVDLHLTIRGGQLAPVVFHLPDGDVSPYSLSPWLPAEHPAEPALLSVLRGDFFCLPFGPQADGPPHGAPANAQWSPLESGDPRELRLAIEAEDSGARIEKRIAVREGQHAIYAEHLVSRLEGHFSYGSHPILDLSAFEEGAARIYSSPFHWGSVYPGVFSDPARGERQALAAAATFDDLRDVPRADGGHCDLGRYPARPGNDDLVMLVQVPATERQPFAWTAVATSRWIWFALKNPTDFPATLLWLSNGGRSGPPWNGRHLGRLGVEDVCSHFCDGVDLSREDRLAEHGILTSRRFRADQTVSLRTLQALAPLPQGFGEIAAILPAGDAAVAIRDVEGRVLSVPLDWTFVV